MPTSLLPEYLPQYLYGVHDLGGQVPMLKAQRLGWLVDAVDLRVQAGTDYTRLADAGLGILVCLNNGNDLAGTLPPSDQYDAFAARCAAYVARSPGARIWLIGDEMNRRARHPLLPDGSREIITPELYALCFLKCREAIKNVPGHAEDWVIPGAIAPYQVDTGDWVRYLVDVLTLLDTEVDGIALHCYTHDFSVTQITSDVLLDPPYNHYHSDFRAYRDFLNALPMHLRSLPVLITQTSPLAGWENANIGWIQAAYKEIAEWNADPTHQAIQALVLHRWQSTPEHPEWGLQDKPALHDDFLAAMAEGYRVRWSPPLPPLEESPAAPARVTPSEPPRVIQTPAYAAQLLAHDTPVALVPGQVHTVNVRVKNIGTATWHARGAAAVHMGYRWFNTRGELQRDVEDRRTALPDDVAPGAEILLGVCLGVPRTPGIYQLQWDLNYAGERWFTDARASSVLVYVTEMPLAITGWRVEASHNPLQVAHALDGDPLSFWSGGTAQMPGQWFRLNLNAPRWVDGIQFLSPGKNFPAGYVLRVSADGKTWLDLARVPQGNTFDVMHVFAPMLVQYAQIDLLAAAHAPWMISEILVHPALPWNATASHNARAARRAIDNRAETAWTSGVPQTPGMWFQLDLGRIETVSGVSLSAPQNEHPRGFRLLLWNASAQRWQLVCERTDNRAPVQTIFPAQPTQFIHIQLTQASHLPWAIQHLRVTREMEGWLGPRLPTELAPSATHH